MLCVAAVIHLKTGLPLTNSLLLFQWPDAPEIINQLCLNYTNSKTRLHKSCTISKANTPLLNAGLLLQKRLLVLFLRGIIIGRRLARFAWRAYSSSRSLAKPRERREDVVPAVSTAGDEAEVYDTTLTM